MRMKRKHNITLSKVERKVIKHRRLFIFHKRDEPDDYWYRMLMEEVAELTLALEGKHEHTPDLELTEIAGICINWIEKINDENET